MRIENCILKLPGCDMIIADQFYTSSSSGGATITAPPSWINSSLAVIFEKEYTKTITNYWPYNSTSTVPVVKKSGKLPTWAAAVIGVLCGLLVVVLFVGFWIYRRRKNRTQSAPVEEAKSAGTEERNLMDERGAMSPGPGPPSQSTGVETVPNSMISAATPITVESGGDAVYEMQGMLPKLFFPPSSLLLRND